MEWPKTSIKSPYGSTLVVNWKKVCMKPDGIWFYSYWIVMDLANMNLRMTKFMLAKLM